jgi:hypothetical protein
MSEVSIPVDLFNPGQVFASLGFLEAADVLLGDTEGRFDWSQPESPRFWIRSSSDRNPFETVLRNLETANLHELFPKGWPDDEVRQESIFPSPLSEHVDEKGKPSTTKLPGLLGFEGQALSLESWADGSSRTDFKLYSGNRSGCSIASDMLFGKRGKPKKGKTLGEILNRGIRQIIESDWKGLTRDPLNVTVSMAGSFNMDPRGAWNSMDAGYSPNQHGDDVAASPVVEFFGCLALEHFRPFQKEKGEYEYAAWDKYLPPLLARVACSVETPFRTRRFTFSLALSGKNKLVTFALESTR